jgi:hypothetical protein
MVAAMKEQGVWRILTALQHILAHSFAHRNTQPFYFQAIPHSLHKTPGVGERCHLLEGMNDKQCQNGAVAACRLCGAEWSA